MATKIKTLSLAGYIRRENKDGYAVALCLPTENYNDATKVLEQFSDGSNFPEGTTVNVQTGIIIRPNFLKGIEVMQQASDLRIHTDYNNQPMYEILPLAEANKYYKAETSPLLHKVDIDTGA